MARGASHAKALVLARAAVAKIDGFNLQSTSDTAGGFATVGNQDMEVPDKFAREAVAKIRCFIERNISIKLGSSRLWANIIKGLFKVSAREAVLKIGDW